MSRETSVSQMPKEWVISEIYVLKERIKNEWVFNEYGLSMRVQCKGTVEIVLSCREINVDWTGKQIYEGKGNRWRGREHWDSCGWLRLMAFCKREMRNLKYKKNI